MILQGVSFFNTKIFRENKTKNENILIFNPLVSGPGWFEGWKELGVENLAGALDCPFKTIKKQFQIVKKLTINFEIPVCI